MSAFGKHIVFPIYCSYSIKRDEKLKKRRKSTEGKKKKSKKALTNIGILYKFVT
jgi:hypothetical protein